MRLICFIVILNYPFSMSDLDLTDLRIFEELYRAGSVTRAAERIGLSQPSISIRLGRLRRHFNDPLFVRTSTGLRPTPRADDLRPAIRQALTLLEGTLRQQSTFDAKSAERTFTMCMSNIQQVVVLPRLLEALKSRAPSIRVEVLMLDEPAPRMLASGEADIGLGFTVEIEAGFYQKRLFSDGFVCLASRRHPRIGSRITRKQYLEEGHIDVATRWTGHGFLMKALEDIGVHRRIVARVPSFLGVPEIVAQTAFLALVPQRFGAILSRQGRLKTLPLPFRLPSYQIQMYWHERYHRDVANRWLRDTVSEVFHE
jgi:DNA-binding transcriptional LysR family regulator